MRTTRLIALAAALGIGALLALIALSSVQMSLMAGLRATVDTRWGVTTMVDLYLGLLVVAGWIAHRERSTARTLVWLLGLCLLGNLVTLVYLLIASLRARSIEDLFRPVLR
jgi:hypothetical protein